jgi:hypothetical protein
MGDLCEGISTMVLVRFRGGPKRRSGTEPARLGPGHVVLVPNRRHCIDQRSIKEILELNVDHGCSEHPVL